MRITFPIVGLLLFICTACNNSKSTDELLAKVWESDQSIRQQMVELTKAVTTENRTDLIDSLISTSEQVERIDAENMAIVDSLLQNGLPQGLSAQSYKTIWIVIDHSTLEKQVQYLPLIEKMSTAGLIAPDEYAILFDRVAMKQNRPQRYGSQSVQFGRPDAMQLHIWPVENPIQLDSLRSEVGMSPIAEYLKTLTKTTGIEAKFDPTMTVEELNKIRERERESYE